MNRQATIEQKREAQFHMRLAVLGFNKRQQGYIMGAFREAMKAAEVLQLDPANNDPIHPNHKANNDKR